MWASHKGEDDQPNEQAKKSAACATLGKYTSLGCWFMFEFLGLFVSSALGMQVLLCIEWVKCK